MGEDLPARDAIRELFQLYADDVYRYARLTLGSHEDAKDATQEIFLKAFRAYGRFRQDANAKTWVLAIARNHLIDTIRKRQTERNYLADYRPPHLEGDAASLEIAMTLEASLQKLNPPYRARSYCGTSSI